MNNFKKIAKEIKWKLRSLIPTKNYILFESAPDLSDNTRAVFDEMLKRGLNKKYRFVWLVKDKNAKLPVIENVFYVDKNSFFNRMQFKKYNYCSKCIIFCNKAIWKQKREQLSVFLTHGSPMKSIRDHYWIPRDVDYCLSASKGIEEVTAYEHQVSKERMVSLGFPRNDVLTNESINLQEFFETKFKKIIVWYPTYRQHKNKGQEERSSSLPIIHDMQKAIELNECAKKNEVLIVLKPHFAQDVSYVTDLHLSNIVFIKDAFFEEHQISSYEFVGSCDALLTDYSSIYFDYTLCDKPIGVIWEDIEEYKKSQGFALDLDYYMKGAEKLYVLDELKTFVENVAQDRDVLKEERREIRDVVNFAPDGQNSKRVVDFIIEKAKL